MAKIAWNIKPIRGGYCATIITPDGRGGAMTIKQRGKTKTDAILKAAGIAARIAGNPIMSAILPPGSAKAIMVAGKLAAAVKLGKGAKFLKKLTGKGAKRLVKKLKFW